MEDTGASPEKVLSLEQEVIDLSKDFKNLIINDRFDEIKRQIDLLPMETRKNLLYDCEIEKNLMFQACLGKATNVVEYFITKCMANINEVTKIGDETLTPLFIAIKTSNNDLIKLLLKHGVNVNWRDPEGRSAIVYACDINKMEAAYTLKNHGADINDDTNQNLCVKSLSYFKRALKLGADVNYVDEKGETTLMKAVSNSNIDIINLLLKEKADIYLRSYESGRNALDLAHFLEKDDVLTYFKENSVYSLADKVISYDLDFALAIIIEGDLKKSLEYVKTSKKLRKKHHNTLSVLISDQPALSADSDLESDKFTQECFSMIDHMEFALRVICRIIEINHPFIEKAFYFVAYSHEFLSHSLTFDILEDFCELDSTLSKPVCCGVFIGLSGAIYLCDRQNLESLESDTLILFIELMIDLIIEVFVPILRKKAPNFTTFSAYKYLLYMVLRLIDIAVDLESSLGDILDRTISDIALLYMDHYPTSMLLIAIERGFAFKTILRLVKGGANVNAPDYQYNSPLHLLAEQPDHLPDKSKIRQLLIDHGGRIDTHNAYGVKPRISLAVK